MKVKTKAALSLAVAAIIISAAYAAILVQRNVPTTMRIERAVAMEVYDTDAVTPLQSIALGDFLWNQAFYYPGKSATEPIQTYYVRNTDQMDFYVEFDALNVTEQVTMLIRMRRLDSQNWTQWQTPQNGLVVYQLPLISQVNNPDPNVQGLQWQLMVACNPGAPFGDFAPTLTFSAVDSPAG